MMRSIVQQENDDPVNPVLIRLYWGYMLKDILHKIGEDATEKNKLALHELHKKVLGYRTTANTTQTIYSTFLFEVTCWWAVEKGIFVRTNENQPIDIENRPLKDVWHLL